jgi:predicted RNA-binding protein with PIN domain
MAKGDGKNKRSKQNKSSPQPTSTSSSPQPTPLRVKSDINIPVRHQIEMARQKKAHQSASVSFRQTKRTAYRKLLDDEEKEEKALQRKRRGQDPDWDVILSRNRTSPLVIVDGYNIINNWPRLKKHMKKGDTARARQMLVDDLETLRTMKGWRIEVVFDGAGRNTVGPLGQNGGNRINQADREVTKSVTKYGVRVVYSGVGTEADTYIEARAFQALNVTAGKTTSSFIIASDDTMIRMAGHEAGAVCMGADRFVSELKALKSSVSHRVEVAVATLNGHAIRPESLRGTTIIPFNRGSFYLVDKRNRTKKQV